MKGTGEVETLYIPYIPVFLFLSLSGLLQAQVESTDIPINPEVESIWPTSFRLRPNILHPEIMDPLLQTLLSLPPELDPLR